MAALQMDGPLPPEIPDKVFFRIGEVARITALKPYVLRYWETEFPILRPGKSRSGQRLYKRSDLDTVLEIKSLLRDRKFTIKGARAELLRLRRARKQAGDEDETVRLTADFEDNAGPSTQKVVPVDSQTVASAKAPDADLVERVQRQRKTLSSVRDALEGLRAEVKSFRASN